MKMISQTAGKHTYLTIQDAANFEQKIMQQKVLT